MADSTELVLGVRLRADDKGAIEDLRWMIGADHADRDAPPAPDGHKLWSLEAARWMLRGGGLATRGRAPELREVVDLTGDEAWELFVWTSFVDRDAVSVAFLDWLGPLVDHEQYFGDKVLGWILWQGASEVVPDLLIYDVKTRRIRQTTVAKAPGLRF